jgi:predicted nucleotidyltransferase component of viral defense system
VRASITDRLNRYATDHGQSIALVRRRFVIARFLTRVFDADPDGWILKGGISMMVRLPQARYSKDLDLHTATDLPESVDELRRTVRDHHLDHFRFEVGPSTELSHDKGVTVTVTASLGGKTYDSFSLDLVGARRTLVGEIERRPIPRLVDTDDFPPETSVPLYPLADQIADKICALYEVHGAAGAASGRFRDLVDLLLISMFLPIDLTSTVDAVERERRVRGLPALPGDAGEPGTGVGDPVGQGRPQQSTDRGPPRLRERAGCRGPLLRPDPRLTSRRWASRILASRARCLGEREQRNCRAVEVE